MDKLRAMAAFVAIADKGSLTAAAASTGASLPAVVRTLAALEASLGVRLINRTTRRLHLTEEGTQYLDHCRAVLGAIRDAEASLASRRTEPQGRLAVTASVLFGRRYVAPIVNDFVSRYAEVGVELLLLDRIVNLIDDGIDVGVRIGHLRDSSLIALPVGRVRRVVCASPKYLRRHGTPRTPADLSAHRCVHFAQAAGDREWHFREGRRSVGVAISSRLVVNQADAAIDACVAGLGLGNFLSYQTAPQVAAHELRYVLEDYEPEPVPIHLVYPHSRLQSAKVRVFVDACVERLRALRFD